ncbi:GINS complex subunit [Irineochytrium annulatum]|nr:GINS complex subunit [Irineochytrium annulatum]
MLSAVDQLLDYLDERPDGDDEPKEDVDDVSAGTYGDMLGLCEGQIKDMEKMPSADAFTCSIIQQEVERIKFVIRSYLRTRIWKLEKYAGHIMSTGQKTRLGDHEIAFAERFLRLMEDHYNTSCLKSLPDSLQRLHEANEGPDLQAAVFCRIKKELGDYEPPDDRSILMKKGSILLVKYKNIMPLLASGDVELI